MVIEKCILAVITTDKAKVPVAPAVFYCDTMEEMYEFGNNLEAILDGIAHRLSDDVYIIVKH